MRLGPLEHLQVPAGKVFAGLYALDRQLALVVATGSVMVPVIHRMLHRCHVVRDGERGQNSLRECAAGSE
jgi:hypothetical protein